MVVRNKQNLAAAKVWLGQAERRRGCIWGLQGAEAWGGASGQLLPAPAARCAAHQERWDAAADELPQSSGYDVSITMPMELYSVSNLSRDPSRKAANVRLSGLQRARHQQPGQRGVKADLLCMPVVPLLALRMLVIRPCRYLQALTVQSIVIYAITSDRAVKGICEQHQPISLTTIGSGPAAPLFEGCALSAGSEAGGMHSSLPELEGDFSLNAANTLSADLLFRSGLRRLAPTHDLNAAQLAALGRSLGRDRWCPYTLSSKLPHLRSMLTSYVTPQGSHAGKLWLVINNSASCLPQSDADLDACL